MHSIGKEIGVDPQVILETSHGRRSIDTLKILAPEKANWECKFFNIILPCGLGEWQVSGPVLTELSSDVSYMEGLLPLHHGEDAVEISGARSLLNEIGTRELPWAIVTSGTMPLVSGWLKRMGLPTPEHLITAESVENGKPDPACYLMGRERIKLSGDDKSVLVLEDSPAGIRAGKAAGCKVLGLVTSHTAEQVKSAEPDWIVKDLDSVKIVDCKNGFLTLEFSNCMV